MKVVSQNHLDWQDNGLCHWIIRKYVGVGSIMVVTPLLGTTSQLATKRGAYIKTTIRDLFTSFHNTT